MTLPIGVTLRYSALDSALDERIAAAGSWLGESERCELARLNDAARRQQWLGGRWLAKQLIGEAFGIDDLARLEILTRDERGRGVAPRALVRSQELRLSLSISHTRLGALVALSKSNRFSLGVDLAPTPLSTCEGFLELWFTPFERQWMERDPANRAPMLWAIKESIYKAVNKGQTWNPRQVEVRRHGRGGFDCWYQGRAIHGLSIDLENFEGQTASIVCLRRDGRTTCADAASRPQQASASRQAIQNREQRPRFVACGH